MHVCIYVDVDVSVYINRFMIDQLYLCTLNMNLMTNDALSFLSLSLLSLSLSLSLSLLQCDLKIDNLQSFFDDEDKNKSDNFERDFFEHKAYYYQSKLGIEHVDDSVLLE